MNEQLLTEPELTPIVEAFLETQRDYQQALDPVGWSMSLERFGRQPGTETDYAERLGENIERLAERAGQIAYALEIGNRFGDFLKMGIDVVAYEYNLALWKYNQQQRNIAEAPRRAWAAAYNARLAEIDKQIKGAKSRRSRTWTKWRKNEIDYQTALAISDVIDGEIVALGLHRIEVAEQKFESVAA